MDMSMHTATHGLKVVKKDPFSRDRIVLSLERKLKELTVLYEISQVIGSTLYCQETFSDILKILHAHLGIWVFT